MKEERNGYLLWRIHQIEKNESKEALSHYLASALNEKDSEYKISLNKQEEIKDCLVFNMEADKKLNVHKVLKAFQKRLIKLCEAIQEDNMADIINEEKNWLIISPPELTNESVRLKKLTQSIDDTAYYDVNHLYGPEPHILSHYLSHRKVGMIDWGDKLFLIDSEALQKNINLNCQACTSKYEFGCCCGSPCNYSRKNLKIFKQYEKAIIEEMKQIEPEFYQAIMRQQDVESENGSIELVGFDGAVGECNGRCIMLVREDGMAKCMAHKYALEHHLPVYEVSPLSCLMFPFEVIDCMTDKGRRALLLTGVVEEETAKKIGRWGSYKRLEIDLSCIDESLCGGEFKKEDYKPVYEVNKGLITHEFGEVLYDAVKLLMMLFV